MGMKKRKMSELLQLFEDSLTPADVLAAKLTAEISTAITKERLKLKMSQSEFANHLGVTQSLVSRWEHGDSNFSINKLAEIAAKLNLDIDIDIHPFIKTDGRTSFERAGTKTMTKVIYSRKMPDWTEAESVPPIEFQSCNLDNDNRKETLEYVKLC